ncbi:MAG: hypothetical protein KGH88_08220 [Thaumarchaeota archaeon]|nr:hypothetical protein [Nitrososphaerota archaeon]
MDLLPPIGQWNFGDPFFVGLGFLAGSVGTFIIYRIKKSNLLAYKNI